LRFVIFDSATSGGILDKAIDAEDRKHGDFLRLVSSFLEFICKVQYLYQSVCAEIKYFWNAFSLIQDHVEGYLELAAKSKSYFAKAVSMWDAEYFVKVDDDVHVNIGEYILLPETFS
jgi:hypothetical protein